jgi:cyclic dehypoxanthinyl futalosine synthase
MSSVSELLARGARGERLAYDEGLRLYREASLHELGAAAHERRTRLYPGREVSYVIDTTINYTNICNVHCSFCAFFRPEGHPEGYTMTIDEVLARVQWAAERGATQVMVQGGVNPDLPIDYYCTLFRKIGERFPQVDIHSLSTSEICGIAKREGMSVEDVLVTLREAGLRSLPGAGAEILVERVRKRISARKIDDDRWLEVMRIAQRLGMPTTATMMFGSVETDAERITHLEVLRELQDETKGFLAFIPWYYVPHKTPLRGREASGMEYLRVIAVSRLYLDNFPHVQASWLTPGLKLGQLALLFGADDMGGTILEERVVTLAGSSNRATRADLERAIRQAGYEPVVRNTYFQRRDYPLATSA